MDLSPTQFELASEKEKDSFSTQPVLDPKPTRYMSIQEHINVSTHSIKSTQSVHRQKASILEHICFHEANKFKTLKSNEQIDDHIDMPVEKLHMCMKCAYLITILSFWKK